MNKLIVSVFCLTMALPGVLSAQEFYGKMDVGGGMLLQPDVTGSGVRKGGFTAIFQGLTGEGRIKYGGEFGYTEAYTSWYKDSLKLGQSLILIPFNGVLQYDLGDNNTVPYVGLSVGANLAIEDLSNNNDGANWSSGSKVYGGASIYCGLKTPFFGKYNLDISCRYSRVNTGENVEMLGLYLGIGTKLSFLSESKHDKVVEPLREKEK
jgi:hypothetical protein